MYIYIYIHTYTCCLQHRCLRSLHRARSQQMFPLNIATFKSKCFSADIYIYAFTYVHMHTYSKSLQAFSPGICVSYFTQGRQGECRSTEAQTFTADIITFSHHIFIRLRLLLRMLRVERTSTSTKPGKLLQSLR